MYIYMCNGNVTCVNVNGIATINFGSSVFELCQWKMFLPLTFSPVFHLEITVTVGGRACIGFSAVQRLWDGFVLLTVLAELLDL